MHPAWVAAPRWVRGVVVAAPAAATAGPVLLATGRAPLFRDEVATAQFASLPLGDLWQATGHVERAILPYLVLMKGWLGLAGDSTLAQRVPSIVAAVALVAVVAALGGRLAGPLGGAVAGLVVAVAPLTTNLAVLARPYAVAALVSVAALLALQAALDSGRRAWWVAHAALVTASLLLQPFSMAALPAHVALAFALPGAPRRWRRLAGGWAVAGLAALLVGLGARSQQGQVGWIAELGPRGVTVVVGGVLSGPVAWLAVAAGVVGVVHVVRRRPAPWWWAGTGLVLGPVAFFGAVSVLLHPAFVERYLFLVPTGAALLVSGLAGTLADAVAEREAPADAVGGRRVAAAALLAVAVVAAAALPVRVEVRPVGGTAVAGSWSTDPPSALAAAVGEALRPGDLLVVEQRVGWGGYTGELARAWGDVDLASALDRRAASGDLSDITRVVTSVDPLRTADPAKASPGASTGASEGMSAGPDPVRVVLLSLRSTAAERFVDAAAAGCSIDARASDRRLRDTRLWVLRCEQRPAVTGLSAVADDPVR